MRLMSRRFLSCLFLLFRFPYFCRKIDSIIPEGRTSSEHSDYSGPDEHNPAETLFLYHQPKDNAGEDSDSCKHIEKLSFFWTLEDRDRISLAFA